jgi:hypothetical protein
MHAGFLHRRFPAVAAALRCGGDADRLARRILVEAAPVLSGDKPAMMLDFRDCGHLADSMPAGRVFCRHQARLSAALGLSTRVLRRSPEGSLALFWNPPRLAARLAEPETARFLARRGYPAEADAALDRLAAEFSAAPDACPHEVGVFLGYPVRDVEGFIERPAEALPVRRALWRVFAPAAESLRLMARFRAARARALSILAYESDALAACAILRRLPPLPT